jgi:Flp pilus assembly pilin Flp
VIYRLMGLMHARLARAHHDERGQGTVEYVALILLVAALLAGVVAATKGTKFGTGQIAETIVKQIRNALDTIK